MESLKTFDEFISRQEIILEAAALQEIKDIKKIHDKIQKYVKDLDNLTWNLRTTLEDYSDTKGIPLEAKKLAKDAYAEIEGNFHYVLRDKLTQDSWKIEEAIRRVLEASKIKPKKINVKAPPGTRIKFEDLQNAFRAIDVDKPEAGGRKMYYDRNGSYVMLVRNVGAASAIASSAREVRDVLQDIFDFLEDGKESDISKWIKDIKKNTGYEFSLSGNTLYINW